MHILHKGMGRLSQYILQSEMVTKELVMIRWGGKWVELIKSVGFSIHIVCKTLTVLPF